MYSTQSCFIWVSFHNSIPPTKNEFLVVKRPPFGRKIVYTIILPSNVLHFSHIPHTHSQTSHTWKISGHPSLINDPQTPKTHLSDRQPCTDEYRLSSYLDNRPQAVLHQALQRTSPPFSSQPTVSFSLIFSLHLTADQSNTSSTSLSSIGHGGLHLLISLFLSNPNQTPHIFMCLIFFFFDFRFCCCCCCCGGGDVSGGVLVDFGGNGATVVVFFPLLDLDFGRLVVGCAFPWWWW